MIKEHCCYLTQATIVKQLLEKPRGIPPKPNMIDNLLDVPKVKRGEQAGVSYHDLNAPVLNPTVLPDRFLNTVAPIFIIRHPAKQVGSYFKASKVHEGSMDSSEFEIATTFKFSRLLFDYFKNLYRIEKNSRGDVLQWPIVVDGDDLINDTEGLAKRVCAVTHLDPNGVIYEWEKGGEPKDVFEAVFLGTLNKSSGVVKTEVSRLVLNFEILSLRCKQTPEKPSITREAKKWEAEWGLNVAHDLVQIANRAMADYEYLHQFCL